MQITVSALGKGPILIVDQRQLLGVETIYIDLQQLDNFSVANIFYTHDST